VGWPNRWMDTLTRELRRPKPAMGTAGFFRNSGKSDQLGDPGDAGLVLGKGNNGHLQKESGETFAVIFTWFSGKIPRKGWRIIHDPHAAKGRPEHKTII